MMTVSIITPSFNQGRFIERTIRSVLSQGFPDLEYVVFDGGSTDGTLDILKRYEPRLRWVSEKDKGQTNAVNKGILSTSGEIIGWLNSDDIYCPGAIQTACDFFGSYPEVDILYGNACHINESDQAIEPYPTEPWNVERLRETCYICQPAVFFRRRVVKRFGLLDERLNYCMDYEYWLRLAEGGARFSYVDQVLAGSRLYAETKTAGSRVSVHREINKMMCDRFGKVPDRCIFNFARVISNEKGLNRQTPFRYAASVSVLSIFFALQWNKGVSLRLLKIVSQWISGNFHRVFR